MPWPRSCVAIGLWAWWIVAVLLLALVLVGVFVYPSMFGPELQTPIGWLENDLYIGLLVVAEFLCVQRLRGTTLGPGAGRTGSGTS